MVDPEEHLKRKGGRKWIILAAHGKGAEEKKAQVYAWRRSIRGTWPIVIGTRTDRKRSGVHTVPEGHITVKIRPSQALSDLLVEEFKKGL